MLCSRSVVLGGFLTPWKPLSLLKSLNRRTLNHIDLGNLPEPQSLAVFFDRMTDRHTLIGQQLVKIHSVSITQAWPWNTLILDFLILVLTTWMWVMNVGLGISELLMHWIYKRLIQSKKIHSDDTGIKVCHFMNSAVFIQNVMVLIILDVIAVTCLHMNTKYCQNCFMTCTTRKGKANNNWLGKCMKPDWGVLGLAIAIV